jgi:predicted nucleotidyltransferase
MPLSESSLYRSEAERVIAACRLVLERWGGKGIVAVYVYGSILGPRHRSDSDVDLAVLDRPKQPLGWPDQSVLMDEIERAIQMPVDLRMLRECTLSHQAHILQRGEIVWIADKAVLDEYTRDILTRYGNERESRDRLWSSTLQELMSHSSPSR